MNAGEKLGGYEIKEPLGAGGMGEVYRAHDARLDRDVAIKVLPEEFVADPERLARFEREAKLLAQLNHPNIAAIYGFEDAGGVRFIAMECVDGETLAGKLATVGRLEVDEALEIARGIAEALEAAHGAGIVHRDLKPANVKITPDGRVKVLDFGLAKAWEGKPMGGAVGSGTERVAGASTGISHSPTFIGATRTGIILGTAAYMSPEQARGKPVDKRTDIWAFGCGFYEMLAGKKAFRGETVSDTLAAVLKESPDWSALPPETPPMLRALLQRCLRRDPSRRLHDIADARIEIEEIREAPGGVLPLHLAPTGNARVWGRLAPWAVAVAAVIVAAWGWTHGSGETPFARPLHLSLPIPSDLHVAGSAMVVSPDGEQIVFGARRDGETSLFRFTLGLAGPEKIPGTEEGQAPFFSPDGNWLGFWAEGWLKKVPVTGGRPLDLVAVTALRGATWTDGGRIVYAPTITSGLWQVPANGGEAVELTTLNPEETSHRWPEVLPGDRGLLFSSRSLGGGAHIVAQRLDGSERRRLIDGNDYISARYVPGGYLAFVQDGVLFVAPFDVEALEVSGPAIPAVQDVGQNAAGSPEFAFGPGRWLAYLSREPAGETRLVWVDATGVERELPLPARRYTQPRLSPGGERLAVIADGDIYVHDIAAGTFTRLTFEGARYPTWRPGGQAVAFEASGAALWRPADGNGPIEELMDIEYLEAPSDWSRDGVLALTTRHPNTGVDIWTWARDREPAPFLASPSNERWPRFSPNGRWIAYASDEAGPSNVFVRAYPDTGAMWQISNDGGISPVWSRDGRSLFYRSGDALMVARVNIEGAFSHGIPEPLVSGNWVRGGGSAGTLYDVHPDGGRFLMLRSEASTDRGRINIILGWSPELVR